MQIGSTISWRDYEGLADGSGGAHSGEMLQNLKKALTAGSNINAPAAAPGVGFPLRVESLESVLSNTTYRMEHVRLWKGVPKQPAFNTVEEYNRVNEYGALNGQAWITEGELPQETDTTYERVYATVKYLGTLRRVTHVMSIVKPAHGNVIANETVNGTMWLLRQIEQALFYGDSTLDATQFDGFSALIENNAPATHVIDLRGAALTEDDLMDGALTVSNAPAYGRGTHLHINPTVQSDLSKAFFPKARYDLYQKDNSGLVGTVVNGWASPSGHVVFEPNVFLDLNMRTAPTGATGNAATRPATPTLSTGVTTPVNANSQFLAGVGDHDAGNYIYRVAARNRFGRSTSLRVPAAGNVTVAAGDEVTFGITPAIGTPTVTYYEVFRTLRGGADSAATSYLILRVANAAGVGEQTIQDLNDRLPRTTEGFLFQQDDTNMSVAQLAPMLKVPLATIDANIRWMQLIYLVPKLRTPRHNVIYRNIGRAVDFVGTP